MTTNYTAFGGIINLGTSLTCYNSFVQSGQPSISNVGFSVEAQAQVTWQQAGTFSALSIFNGQSTGNTVSTTCVHRTGGVTGNQTITVTTTGLTRDVTHTDSVSAGNLVNAMLTTAASGVNMSMRTLGENFTPTNSGNTCGTEGCFGNVITTVVAGTSYYNALCSLMNKQSTEANAQVIFNAAVTLQNLGVYVSANTATTAAAHSRIGGVNGNLVVNISSGTTGQIQDTTHTDSIAAGQAVNQSFGSSSGTSITLWNIACDVISTNYQALYYGSNSNGVAINSTTQNNVALMGNLNNSTAAATQSTNTAYTAIDFQTNVLTNASAGTTNCFVDKNGSHGNGTTSYATTVTGLVTDVTHTDAILTTTTTCYDLVTTTANQPVFSNVGIVAQYAAPILSSDWISGHADSVPTSPRLNASHMTEYRQGAVSPVFKENINFDKWGPHYEDFTRKAVTPLATGFQQGAISPTFKEAIFVDKWEPQYPDFAVRKQPRSLDTGFQQGSISPTFKETIYLDKWAPKFDYVRKMAFVPMEGYTSAIHLVVSTLNVGWWLPEFQDWLRKAPRPLDAGYQVGAVSITFKETINYDKWGPEFSDFTRKSVSPLAAGFQQGSVSTIFKENINLDKWNPSYADFTRTSKRALDVGILAGPISTIFKESVFLDKWLPEFADRVPRILLTVPAANYELGPISIIFKENVFLDKWNPEIPDRVPVWLKRVPLMRNAIGPISSIFKEAIFLDKWIPEYADRIPRALASAPLMRYDVSAISPTFLEKIYPDKWIPAFADFTRKMARPLDVGVIAGAISNIFKEAIFLDKWAPRFADLTRRAARALDIGYVIGDISPVFRENILLDKWIPAFADFTRKQARALDTGYQISALSIVFHEIIYPDKWMPEFADFTRNMPRMPVSDSVQNEFSQIVTFSIDEWIPEYPDFTRRINWLSTAASVQNEFFVPPFILYPTPSTRIFKSPCDHRELEAKNPDRSFEKDGNRTAGAKNPDRSFNFFSRNRTF